MNKTQLFLAIKENKPGKTRNARYALSQNTKDGRLTEGRLQLYNTVIIMWRESVDNILELYINTGGFITQTTMSYINAFLRAKAFPFAVRRIKGNRWVLYTTNSEGFYPTKGELMYQDSINLTIRTK